MALRRKPLIQAGYFQFFPVFKNKQANFDRVESALNSYTGPLDLLVLPELFTTGYFFTSSKELEPLAEPAEGETLSFLKRLAAQKNCALYGGFAEKEGSRLYNSALLVSPQGKYWVYRKTHLFGTEKAVFAPGDTGFHPVTLTLQGQKIKVGMMICFDWFFPESARTLSLRGAQILLHAANLVMPYCPDATPTRALENQVFIILADRTGEDCAANQTLKFIGQSRIVGPKGEVLAASGEKEEEIRTAALNPAAALNKKLNPFNDLFEDRRPEFYQ